MTEEQLTEIEPTATRETLLAGIIEAASVVFVEGKPPDRLIRYWNTLADADLVSVRARWDLDAVFGRRLADSLAGE